MKRRGADSGAVGDMTVVAAMVILAVLIIVVCSVSALVRYLRGVVDDASKRMPGSAAETPVWLHARKIATEDHVTTDA
jgi:hypothetical protein